VGNQKESHENRNTCRLEPWVPKKGKEPVGASNGFKGGWLKRGGQPREGTQLRDFKRGEKTSP